MENESKKTIGIVGMVVAAVFEVIGVTIQPFGAPLPIMHIIFGVLFVGSLLLYLQGSKEED